MIIENLCRESHVGNHLVWSARTILAFSCCTDDRLESVECCIAICEGEEEKLS